MVKWCSNAINIGLLLNFDQTNLVEFEVSPKNLFAPKKLVNSEELILILSWYMSSLSKKTGAFSSDMR